MIQLVIIEDDKVIQESLKSYFKAIDTITIVACFSSVEDFMAHIKTHSITPNCLLLDINLEGMSGIEGIPLLMNEFPNLAIIMLTTFEDNESIFNAISSGATSYISKQASLSKIEEAVRIAGAGGSYMSPAIARKIVNHFSKKTVSSSMLTPRQKEIVQGIVDGKSYKMIASDLFVSIDTVRSHIKNIYKILEINSKAELIRKSFSKEL